MPETTIHDVVQFIQERASTDALDTINESARVRHRLLQDQAAAAVEEGMRVRLTGLSPQYINGLTGTVRRIDHSGSKRKATVTLDKDSTESLATASAKYRYLLGRDSHDLRVPLGCCRPID